jgi:hypothetical protein
MPSWLKEVIKLQGFIMPFIYAYAVYRICLYFDKRGLSSKAKKALTDWLQPREYDKRAVGDAIIEIFDRIYTSQLLTWRAFVRSSLLTICAYVILFYEIDSTIFYSSLYHLYEDWYMLLTMTLRNVILDYVALFIVKWFLVSGKEQMLRSLLLGPLIGIILVAAILFFLNLIIIYLHGPLDYTHIERTIYDRVKFAADISLAVKVDVPGGFPASIAALVVHLWLPLFGLCVAILRMLNYFRAAVGMTQEILSRGTAHPLEAIGYVAAVIVFVTTAAFRWAFATH